MFDIQKNVGFSRLMEMAKFIFRCSLPIKCMEALILSIYLTNQIHRLVRFPISFVSAQNDHYYYHIGRVKRLTDIRTIQIGPFTLDHPFSTGLLFNHSLTFKVLGIYFDGKFGSMGLSRKDNLMGLDTIF